MKQASFHSMAEFYQAVVAQKAKNYGEQIARLRVSVKQRYNYSLMSRSLQ